MDEQGGDRRRGLLGEAAGSKVGRHKGVGTVVEHALGELLGVCWSYGYNTKSLSNRTVIK